ncbi:hypothetical protein CK203_061049 [Vitis vinifera]|uniref:DUF241 domain protein n=1 Tax=Vitis vinifera TaxID=29760 RepID=A0A438GLH4_VITVI|nr:hypothetical protein CK203_061049 [Vitis vinifera]
MPPCTMCVYEISYVAVLRADAKGGRQLARSELYISSARPPVRNMASSSSPPIPKTSYHARSISLPPRPHPLIPEIDEHLCRLGASEAISSSSSITDKLTSLNSLYDCMENLLLLSLSRQALVQHQNQKWVNEVADGYLLLLDLCSVAEDALLQTKEGVQELQSTLRRRPYGEHGAANEVTEYLASRKKVKKVVSKSLRDLKSKQRKCDFSISEKKPETVALVCILREVEVATLTVLESLLSSIAGPKMQSNTSKWSLVSRLMHSKRVESEEEKAEFSEFEKIDAEFQTYISQKTSKSFNIHAENMKNLLGNLELSIQDLDGGVECLFRRLIKTRVSLLNILNH